MIVKNVENTENNSITFEVEVTPDEFEEAVNEAYLKNKKKISVPGFRKGKAPRMVIEGMYGTDAFYEDAIQSVSPKAYQFALNENEWNVVGRPDVNDAQVGDDKNLTVKFEAALYPEVTLGQYKDIETVMETFEITDEKVDEYLAEMQKRNGRQISVDREAKLGDTVNLDFDGYMDGKQFEGGFGEGQLLELGSNSFVPGFEDQLVGKKAGDECEVNVTFPEDYHEGFSGKPATFKVKVNEIFENELPELDDEFAKDVSESDTLDEYKVTIREELETAAKKNVKEEFFYNVMNKAIENMKVDVPIQMIEERMETILQEYDRNLMAQGIRLEEYVRMSGMDIDSFQAMIRPQAENQVKNDLLLEAIAKEEKIEVTDEEIETALKEIADKYNITIEELSKALPKEEILKDMKKRKASDIIMDSAVELPPEAKEEAAE